MLLSLHQYRQRYLPWYRLLFMICAVIPLYFISMNVKLELWDYYQQTSQRGEWAALRFREGEKIEPFPRYTWSNSYSLKQVFSQKTAGSPIVGGDLPLWFPVPELISMRFDLFYLNIHPERQPEEVIEILAKQEGMEHIYIVQSRWSLEHIHTLESQWSLDHVQAMTATMNQWGLETVSSSIFTGGFSSPSTHSSSFYYPASREVFFDIVESIDPGPVRSMMMTNPERYHIELHIHPKTEVLYLSGSPGGYHLGISRFPERSMLQGTYVIQDRFPGRTKALTVRMAPHYIYTAIEVIHPWMRLESLGEREGAWPISSKKPRSEAKLIYEGSHWKSFGAKRVNETE